MKLVYILGNAYSGSTLLGFLLGAAKEALFLGELRYFPSRNITKRRCACDSKVHSCRFWAPLLEQNLNAHSEETYKALSTLILDQLGSSKPIGSEKEILMEEKFLKSLFDQLPVTNDKNIIIDSSKSLWRLKFLEQIPELEIKIVHLRRSFRSNISSFVKHKKPFFYNILKIHTNNWLMDSFLKGRNDYMRIEYSEMCRDPKKVFSDLSDFLQISDFDPFKMENIECHAYGGNSGTFKQFISGNLMLREDSNWKKNLKKWQILFLQIFS